MLIGAAGNDIITNHFNGKIERPFFINHAINEKESLDIAKGKNDPESLLFGIFLKIYLPDLL